MTGISDSSSSARMSSLPPRGTMTSTSPFWRSSARVAARSVVRSSSTEETGKPASATAPANTSAIAAFVQSASEPPLRIVALPDFKHSAAASAVTLGRDS
jgi:hypothetical protein